MAISQVAAPRPRNGNTQRCGDLLAAPAQISWRMRSARPTRCMVSVSATSTHSVNHFFMGEESRSGITT